jgi:hypothetical protein
MVSEPADLLQRLYAAVDDVARAAFAPTLLRFLNQENARVVARSLAVTGNAKEIASVAGKIGPEFEELWRGLVHTMRFESPTTRCS